jgi:hypothetical protein
MVIPPGETEGVEVGVIIDVPVGLLVGVAVVGETVTCAPLIVNPLKLRAWPFVPAAPVALNM